MSALNLGEAVDKHLLLRREPARAAFSELGQIQQLSLDGLHGSRRGPTVPPIGLQVLTWVLGTEKLKKNQFKAPGSILL